MYIERERVTKRILKQYTSAYVSIRQHTSAHVSKCKFAYVYMYIHAFA